MFGKAKKQAKKTKPPAPAHGARENQIPNEGQTETRPAQIRQSMQRSWLSQLEGQFLISGQGVVMKVYIEN